MRRSVNKKPARSGNENSSRERLLQAAEELVATIGFHSLTTRRIGDRAGSNISQIQYYFGGLDGLVDALLQINLERVTAAQVELRGVLAARKKAAKLHDLVEAFLRPLWVSAAFTAGATASHVVQELYRHASPPVQKRAAKVMRDGQEELFDSIARLVPFLNERTLYFRLCVLTSSAMAMKPPASGWQLFESRYGDAHAGDDAWAIEDIIRMGTEALKARMA